jgi:methyltransferase (TIGR00027 family)
MDDAESVLPIVGDSYAKRFMDERAMAFYRPFRVLKMPAVSNAVRCRIIDDLVREELRKDARTRVVTIGAGFDTRPYRLRGGSWIELDESQIIDYKSSKLAAAEAANPLARISIDFSTETIASKLERVGGDDGPVVIVIEGVFTYLEPSAITSTLSELQQLFPRHLLLCDLMNKRFFDAFAHSVHEQLTAAGARFSERPEDPAALFLEHDYVETARIPMFERTVQMGVLWKRARTPNLIARILLALFREAFAGFAVHRFSFGGAPLARRGAIG